MFHLNNALQISWLTRQHRSKEVRNKFPETQLSTAIDLSTIDEYQAPSAWRGPGCVRIITLVHPEPYPPILNGEQQQQQTPEEKTAYFLHLPQTSRPQRNHCLHIVFLLQQSACKHIEASLVSVCQPKWSGFYRYWNMPKQKKYDKIWWFENVWAEWIGAFRTMSNEPAVVVWPCCPDDWHRNCGVVFHVYNFLIAVDVPIAINKLFTFKKVLMFIECLSIDEWGWVWGEYSRCARVSWHNRFVRCARRLTIRSHFNFVPTQIDRSIPIKWIITL